MAVEEEVAKEPSAPETSGNTGVDDDKATDATNSPPVTEGDEVIHSTAEEHTKRVYVNNLAWEVTSEDLSELMKGAGFDVKFANVLSSPDGRSKGCGIVEFATADMANEAVKTMNDKELKGRLIYVREDRGERRSSGGRTGGFDRAGFTGRGRSGRGQSSGGRRSAPFSSNEGSKGRRVYVGNLSWEVSWQDLKDHMVTAGDVIHAEVIRDSSGRSKGCGIVEFASEEGALNAISTLTDSELKGRWIFVREDREINKQPGRGFSGRGRGRDNRRFQNTY